MKIRTIIVLGVLGVVVWMAVQIQGWKDLNPQWTYPQCAKAFFSRLF